MTDKTQFTRQFISVLPHAMALGMEQEEVGDGRAVMSMPYNEKLIGDPETGVVHGGAVSALMDTACGAAVISHPRNPAGTATIDLRIEYLRAATPGQRIRAEALCYHVTRSVAFVRATATDDDTENLVATATGTFTVDNKL